MRSAGANAVEAQDLQKKCRKTGGKGVEREDSSAIMASIENISFLSSGSTGKATLLFKQRHNEII